MIYYMHYEQILCTFLSNERERSLKGTSLLYFLSHIWHTSAFLKLVSSSLDIIISLLSFIIIIIIIIIISSSRFSINL